MKRVHDSMRAAVAALLVGATGWALAAVSAEEAARLKGELTPLGGERAGNKDGSIPAWEGGYAKPPSPGVDPFKDDKPLLSINAKNAGQYEVKLTDGIKALLKKYPDSFRMDVYPTRRTAVAPQWVYDNTFKNATRSKLENGVLQGALGGVPFPIAKNGLEVIWNHQTRWRGAAVRYRPIQYQLTTDGKPVKVTDLQVDYQFPYYYQELTPEQFYKDAGGYYFQARLLTTAPAIRAGDAFAGHINVDPNKDEAWLYLTGQRRVRKLPNACCDTPNPNAGGILAFDEVETFTGRVDRFDWKLVGKQEMYIPYNNNRFNIVKNETDVLAAHHANPDHMRWELHRVWVIEATLKPDQRHQAVRSRYYCDEDTWICVLGDRWDAKGQLWKMTWGAPNVAPDIPAVAMVGFGFNDLLSGAAFVAGVAPAGHPGIEARKRWPETYFTPDALAGEGVR